MGLGIKNVLKHIGKASKKLESIYADETIRKGVKETINKSTENIKRQANNINKKVTESGLYDNALGKTLAFGGKASKKILNSTVKIKKNPERFIGYDIGLTKKAVAGVMAYTAIAPVVNTTSEMYQKSKYGEIEGGYMPGTINPTSSPTHESLLTYANSPNGMKEFSKKIGSDFNRSGANVDPEIVFALHNLRNGGNQ